MSYILDALKKAERERHLAKVPTVNTVHRISWDRGRPVWLWIVVAAVLANAAVLIWVLRPETAREKGTASTVGPAVSAPITPATPQAPAAPADRPVVANAAGQGGGSRDGATHRAAIVSAPSGQSALARSTSGRRAQTPLRSSRPSALRPSGRRRWRWRLQLRDRSSRSPRPPSRRPLRQLRPFRKKPECRHRRHEQSRRRQRNPPRRPRVPVRRAC